MWVSWWTKRCLGSFLPFSLTTNFIPPFLLTHLIHSVSFHFIGPCDGTRDVVGRHSCYSLTFNIVASSHQMSSLDSALCRTRIEDILYYKSQNKILRCFRLFDTFKKEQAVSCAIRIRARIPLSIYCPEIANRLYAHSTLCN